MARCRSSSAPNTLHGWPVPLANTCILHRFMLKFSFKAILLTNAIFFKIVFAWLFVYKNTKKQLHKAQEPCATYAYCLCIRGAWVTTSGYRCLLTSFEWLHNVDITQEEVLKHHRTHTQTTRRRKSLPTPVGIGRGVYGSWGGDRRPCQWDNSQWNTQLVDLRHHVLMIDTCQACLQQKR